MHECGRLERLPGRFVGHLVGGEATQFLVNEREQGRGDAWGSPCCLATRSLEATDGSSESASGFTAAFNSV